MSTFTLSHPLAKVVMLVLTFIPVAKQIGAQSVNGASEIGAAIPKAYITRYTTQPPNIDGIIDDTCWQKAVWSDKFVDIEGEKKPKPSFDTRMKMMWNDTCLYIAATLSDPHVWATLTRHDAVVFHDNDFEVFIDPENGTHGYFEVEINAFNTIFDLFLNKPYRNGGKALHSFTVTGLQSAVHINGTLNNAADLDSGWSVEMAIPFRALTTGKIKKQPGEGSTWRINFSRVQWNTNIAAGRYIKSVGDNGKPISENNWVWSPQGVINMHWPERWGYLLFTKKDHSVLSEFEPTIKIYQEQYLWLLYHKQQAYFKKYHHYATTLKNLGYKNEFFKIKEELNQVSLKSDGSFFTISILGKTDTSSINNNGLIN
ncbi:MAG: carbohydrate-binding family 9-like protein [Bacteroidota bacterium]